MLSRYPDYFLGSFKTNFGDVKCVHFHAKSVQIMGTYGDILTFGLCRDMVYQNSDFFNLQVDSSPENIFFLNCKLTQGLAPFP